MSCRHRPPPHCFWLVDVFVIVLPPPTSPGAVSVKRQPTRQRPPLPADDAVKRAPSPSPPCSVVILSVAVIIVVVVIIVIIVIIIIGVVILVIVLVGVYVLHGL